MDYGLRHRVALITGATSALGTTIARMLAAHGSWIALNYFADNRAAKALLDSFRSEGGRAMLAAGSVRDAEGAWKIARYVEAEWAQIDIVVHTAVLLIGTEAAESAEPLLTELLPGMLARQWGRAVIFQRGTSGKTTVERHGKNVSINWVDVPEDSEDEALARVVVRDLVVEGWLHHAG